jgi:hypothetical protein
MSSTRTPQQTTHTTEETHIIESPDSGIAMQVYEGTPVCPIDKPLTTTFNGFPASYDDRSSTWTIPTTKALITVTIFYPGSNTIHHMLHQSSSPVSTSAESEQNKKMLFNTLKTIKLTNNSPFTCR